jgi:putative two-component system response regulator
MHDLTSSPGSLQRVMHPADNAMARVPRAGLAMPHTTAESTWPQRDRRSRPRHDAARKAHHDAVFKLARASELNDEDTGGHLLRIRSVVQQLALRLGFPPADAEKLGIDAMLHDVGKLNIPHDILKKRAVLTDAERAIMQDHTIRGERMLSRRESMQRAARIARHHHEHYDGTGYPDRLAGENIPLEARITSVADVLDALMSDRCYKQAWSYEDAISQVRSLAGTHLDPLIVHALEVCNREGVLCAIFDIPSRCAME